MCKRDPCLSTKIAAQNLNKEAFWLGTGAPRNTRGDGHSAPAIREGSSDQVFVLFSIAMQSYLFNGL